MVVSCSYGPGRYDPRYEEQGHDYPIGYVRFTEQRNMVAFLQAIEAGRIDLAPLVTHRFPIERAAEAYEIVRSGSEPHVGIVLEYSSTQQIHESTGSIRVGKVRSTGTRASFVGAGNYTTATLLPAIKSSTKFSLSGLMTQSGRSAQSVANQFGFAFCTDRLDDIIGPDSDVVFIATRHDSHADLVVRALNAGKHVFVEKPLGLTIDELVAIRAAHRSSPGTLLVGFNRRFAPMTKSVLDRFSSTPGPRVVDIRVNAGQLPSDHWMFDPANGGRLIGEGCHFVDLACVLVGQPVTEVFAFAHAGQQVSRVTTDNIVSVLRFADGSVASITYLSVGARSVAKERIEVHAGGGSAIIDDWTTLTIHGADGRSNEVKGPQDKGQRNMVRALEAAICDGAEAVDSSELLLSSFATVLLAETLLIGMPLRLQDVVDLA